MASPHRRKLLVASLGVATVSYVVACDNMFTSGNLPAPPDDASADTRPPTSGNLPAPPVTDGATDGLPPTSGNLPAPPDATTSDASGDATDGANDAYAY